MSRQPRMNVLLCAFTAAGIAAATGCSAGQVTQTSTQVATVNGSSANVGQLALRNIRFDYPSGGSYSEGGTAELVLVVTNQGLEEDTLTEITGDFFAEAVIPSVQRSAGEEAEPGAEAAVPAQGVLEFGGADSSAIELTGLSEELSVSQVVPVTFVFERAGEVTVEVPVANPTEAADRGEGFDFHEEEGE